MKTTTDSKLDELARVPLFAGLPKVDLERIAAAGDIVDAPCGSDLTREGRLGHEVFVLLDGGAAVHAGGEVLNVVEPGSVVGELAVLGRGRRTATVTTTAPSRVFVFAGHEFRRIAHDMPVLASRLLRKVAEHLAA
ncbi:MAG: cyclic nucleotide-binding domain-containing protein [Actinobacteria bacterium]|nr:cyclic nucleotide-binding domain-containing protein [Actinomycetota bacterium]MBV8562629.1 cyclic nucleotide-binding domain-containing protein [Actinomycetota bacterium]